VRTPPVNPRPEPAQPELEPGESKRKPRLAGVLFGVCATAAVLVVAVEFGTVVGEPLGLWRRWLAGDQLGSVRLWGWPLLGWGRSGKVCQFVAGLTVVLDLVGPDRLRTFGGRLRGQSWRRLADRMERPVMASTAVLLLSYYVLVFLFVWAPKTMADLGISLAWLFGPAGFVAALLSLLGVGFLLLRVARRHYDRIGRDGILRHAYRLPPLLVGLVPIVLWVVISRGLLLPLVNGLARVFDRARPGHPLRWGAFALFIVGFQFDLLAS